MSGHDPGWEKSGHVFVSPATRFDADEKKATNRPLALIAGQKLLPSPCAPLAVTLMRFGRAFLPVAQVDIKHLVRVIGDQTSGRMSRTLMSFP